MIRYIPGRMSGLYSPQGHKWKDDSLVKEPLVLNSVGPCYDKCDGRNWAGMEGTEEINLTLYDNENFIGETIPYLG
jgi:hypothetical protein